jgi:hypothetical protein
MRVRLAVGDAELLCDAANPGTRDGLLTLVPRENIELFAGVPFELRLNTRDEK